LKAGHKSGRREGKMVNKQEVTAAIQEKHQETIEKLTTSTFPGVIQDTKAAANTVYHAAASKVKIGGIYMAKYKKAESQGAYIDRLRTMYPFRIIAHGGYEAVLCGVQPLLEGQQSPIYRFPGGPCVVDVNEIEKIVEW